jgi:hypothetical protein
LWSKEFGPLTRWLSRWWLRQPPPLGAFLYYLAVRDTSPDAGRWATLSGGHTSLSGVMNLALLLRGPWQARGGALRNALVVSMPSPLMVAGLALIAHGPGWDRLMIVGSLGDVSTFLVGVGLFLRYVYTTVKPS